MRSAILLVAILTGASLAQAAAAAPLRIHIDHEGDSRPVTLTVEDSATGELLDERAITLDADFELTLQLPESTYTVAIRAERPMTPLPVRHDIVTARGYVGVGIDTRGCPGEHLVSFWSHDTSTGSGREGCLERPAAFDAMIAAADERALPLPRFHVALPRGADRGEWIAWNRIGPILDEEATRVPFETRADVAFPDAWGRDAAGVEIVYRTPSVHGVGASAPSGSSAEATSDRPLEIFRYASGATEATSWSRTLASFGSADSITNPSVALAREVRYDPPDGLLPCLLRAPLQGMSLAPGDTRAADEVCAMWGDAPWRAGAPIEAHGLRALPLYQIGDGRATRWLVVDGLAYPLEVESYEQAEDGIVSHMAWRLVGLDAAGDAIEPSGAPPPEPAAELSALDPLRGPADEGALPFPLALAADAAVRDPTLRDAQAVLARGDAALLGAAYGLARDPTTGATLQQWALVFGASDAEPALVVCSRVEAPLAVPPRCEAPSEPPAFAEPLRDAPAAGRAILPARSATFAAAVARWGAQDPVGFALYRAWPSDGAAVVGVGNGVPASLAPTTGAQVGEATYALLDLASARSLAHADVVQSTAGIAQTPLTPVRDASLRADGQLGAAGLPIVVGAGVALGLLALLGFALYTRLVRARVLDDATRQAIVDVVRDDPGIHASGILERLGKRGGVGEYHLDVLVREGFLHVVSTPGFRRYFAAGSMSAPAMKARATLRDGACEKVHALVLARPGMTLGELADAASITPGYASKTVARLVDAGLVEKRAEGRTVALFAHPEPDRQAQASASRYVRP